MPRSPRSLSRSNSRSPRRKSHKHKTSKSHKRDKSPKETDKTNLVYFSFCDHKHLLECFLMGSSQQDRVIEDFGDFWKFVNKYESMLKNAGQSVLPDPAKRDLPMETQFREFHKRHFISLELSLGEKQSRRFVDERKLSAYQIAQFSEIVLTYLEFKQKEKFAKIRKLRDVQKSLPIYKFKNEIREALQENQVVVIAGDTGCGKSTQVPQYLTEFGFRSIACTQPRRLACVSLSKRVAHEMLDDYGSKVGFQIRFEKNKTSKTNILFITEGLLLRQLAVDSNLEQYDVLILDEIHERNLFGDFLLGVTKCLLRAKPDLKIVLMSATINVGLFAGYFSNETVKLIQVPGRLYPIKTVYLPPPALELKKSGGGPSSSSARLDPGPFIQILNIIDEKYPTTERGDVLIFVSGVNEITTVCDAAKEYAERKPHWIILPLHSALALAEQDKVFDYAPEGMRKCIVSTNIAETSLTVDGVRFVVDSGKVKEMSYDSSCKGQRLKEFWVSKSSADQRKGRAGRTGPGTCYRIFSEKQYESFEDYPTPEIFRVPLETILLQMISMGLPNVRVFPFVEAPSEESIEQTILALKQHAALTSDEKITPLGKALATLPVEISIGKMLLMGCVFMDVQKILTLAAAMSVQSPFTNRAFTDPKCERERTELESDQGDVFTLLNAYRQWLDLKWDKSENTRRWCHKLGLEEQRFYEIAKLRNQFQNILESCNMLVANNTEAASSSDRARRHGEVRMLKSIKRAQKFQEPRKRKLLKREQGSEEQFDDHNDDIRDVDFRLRHDSSKMEVLLSSSDVRKHRNLVLLKLIIISGFYPQIAIPDEFNYCKGGTQQFFHTTLKPFVSIHPNSQFSKNFEILKLTDSDIVEKPTYYTPKAPLSSAHQVLGYQNLLETAKPYLMNSIRMPAAQTLLLFSFSIETNASITKVVCDSWLCLEFPVPQTGVDLLLRAIRLRRTWMRLLSSKLDDLSNQVQTKKTERELEQQTQLWDDLIAFMSVGVTYTIKRLLPADLKSLYSYEKPKLELLHPNPFAEDFVATENTEKGGANVTENVVYGCLREPQWAEAMDYEMSQHSWTCEVCDLEVPMYGIMKLIHKNNCKKKKEHRKDEVEEGTSRRGSNYFCPNCERRFQFSQIDILKHKKYCSSGSEKK